MGFDRKRKFLGVLLLMCTLWIPNPSWGAAETVFLPITLEYPVIQSLLVSQLFNAPDQRAIVIDEASANCVHIELSNPEVSRERSMIKVGTNIAIQAGIPIMGTCMGRIEWEGYIEVLQRPVLDDQNWQVRFETVDSRVFNVGRKPILIASRLWNLIKTHVHPYLSQTSIELSPLLTEVKDFLPLAFLPEERLHVHRWFETLRLGPVQVDEAAVKVNLVMEVQPISKPRASAIQLSPSEIERLSGTWEYWDSLLVFEIESLIGQPITDTERENMLEILLENRYEFLQVLEQKTISPDLIRQQFVWTWQRLARTLRKYLVNQKTGPFLSYLAFFTASDALVAMDKLGPALGLEISRDGLIRLARLLSAGETDPPLYYSYAVDPMLRNSLGLGPPLEDFGPISNMQELELPAERENTSRPDDRQSRLHRFLFPRAWATEAIPTLFDRVKEWIPPARNPEPYIGKVRDLLEGTADKVLAADPRAGEYNAFFHLLIMATVWQESCWRHFVVKDSKLRYLVSYNRTSTGLMQINERVWRGLYRVESLRWNIAYNARAGAEILHLYLRNFALKEIKPETPADFDTIARVTYAIYNGGPGQLKQYFKRSNAKALYQSDRLFWEKYSSVKANNLNELVQCMTGQ